MDCPPFPEGTEERWRIKIDECGIPYIVLGATQPGIRKKYGDYYNGWEKVYMYDKNTVAATLVRTRPFSAQSALQRKVSAHVELLQEGDQEFTVAVPVGNLDEFCKALGAKKRWKQSDEHRAKSRSNLIPHEKGWNSRGEENEREG